MGETFSQLGAQEDENTAVLPPDSSSHGGGRFFSAPCERAAGASYVTCPTCQGNKEIPRGEWLKALERACNPGKALGSQRLWPGASETILEWGWVSQLLVPQGRAGQGDANPPALVVLPSPWSSQPLCPP